MRVGVKILHFLQMITIKGNIIQQIKYKLENFYFNTIALLIYYITDILEKYVLKHNLSLKLAELCRENNLERTLYYYKKHLEFNNNDINTIIEFAQFLTDNNMVKQSQNVCMCALKNNPNHISLLLITCQNFIKTEEYNKVIEQAEKILYLDYKEQYARKFLCEAYSRL